MEESRWLVSEGSRQYRTAAVYTYMHAPTAPSTTPRPPSTRRILRQITAGTEKGLQAEVLKRDFSREVRQMAARTGAGT